VNRWRIILAVCAALIVGCGTATDPVAPPDAALLEGGANGTGDEAAATGAVFTGSAIAVTATIDNVSSKSCDSGPVPKLGGRVHINSASASMAGVLTAEDLYCHAGGVNNKGYGEAGGSNLAITIGGNTIVAGRVHSMVGSLCPPNGAMPSSQGHSTVKSLRVNGRTIAVTKELNQRIDLRNGYLLLNEQTSFVTQFHAGRTVIAIHVFINGAPREGGSELNADIVIGRTQTHIDCP
jgi:hypothetical protein